MVYFSLKHYIDRVHDGSVSYFANSLNVSASVVHRWIKANSRLVMYLDGKPKLVKIQYGLNAMPYSITFDVFHNYILMFSYNGLDYFVSKRYNDVDQVIYSLNTIGDAPPVLSLDYELNMDIGLNRFTFDDLFEFVFTDTGSYWISSNPKHYVVKQPDSGDGAVQLWDSLRAAYNYAVETKGSLFCGDSLLFRGDIG